MRPEVYTRPEITLPEIEEVREILRQGCDLQVAAECLGVLRRDVDYWLWRWLGVTTSSDGYEPMFD